MASILIADDDSALRGALAEAVADLGHVVREAANGRAVLDIVAEGGIDAVLLDLRMPGLEGLDVLRRLRAGAAAPAVAILTGHATAANTIEAMRLGAVDHLRKPITQDELRRVVEAMVASSAGARDKGTDDTEAADSFIGSSTSLRNLQKTIGRLADGTATVLVTGETGTGKELVARALHRHGSRSASAFVAVNCAAIPRDLLESELFGHVRGAFTGATADRSGAFRDAHRGTLFLDEVGDMDLAMQAKILRVLQDRIVTPVGGKPIAVDTRIVAATNRRLDERVREGTFREDLFYRLAVVPLHLPPLRERIADIVPLAEFFLRQGGGPSLEAEAAAVLLRHAWPGNVRELKNAMQRIAALVHSSTVATSDLAFLGTQAATPSVSDSIAWPDEDLPTAVARLEEHLIRRALARANGNRAEAARMLNIRRQFLYAKLERYNLGTGEDLTGQSPELTERD